MNSVALWIAVAVVLLAVTALQVLVIALSLADGASAPPSTLSGILTLILGIYAVRQVRRLRRRETTR